MVFNWENRNSDDDFCWIRLQLVLVDRFEQSLEVNEVDLQFILGRGGSVFLDPLLEVGDRSAALVLLGVRLVASWSPVESWVTRCGVRRVS